MVQGGRHKRLKGIIVKVSWAWEEMGGIVLQDLEIMGLCIRTNTELTARRPGCETQLYHLLAVRP